MGSPSRAGYFEVTYMLSCKFTADDDAQSNIFHWAVRLPGEAIKSPYADIEAEAARLIGPTLRAVADAVERQVAEYDAGAQESEKSR
jgi:hypothetical protein